MVRRGHASSVTVVGRANIRYVGLTNTGAAALIALATTITHEDPNEAHGAGLEPGQPQSVAGLEPTAKEI